MWEMERVMGIEPTLVAWEATVLPLNYTRAGCRENSGLDEPRKVARGITDRHGAAAGIPGPPRSRGRTPFIYGGRQGECRCGARPPAGRAALHRQAAGHRREHGHG